VLTVSLVSVSLLKITVMFLVGPLQAEQSTRHPYSSSLPKEKNKYTLHVQCRHAYEASSDAPVSQSVAQ